MKQVEFIIALLIIIFAGGIYYIAFHKSIEKFTSAGSKPNEQDVIDAYQQLLQRQPSPTELVNHTRSLQFGLTTIDTLKQRIVDSDEYDRILKTQSNDLNPTLHKLIVDRQLIHTLATLYKRKRGTEINPRMSLPLKDLYAYLNYKTTVFEAVLSAPQYAMFETDALNASFLNRDKMLALFQTHYESLASSNLLGVPSAAKINGLPPFVATSANVVGQSTYQSESLDKSLYQPEDYDILTPTTNSLVADTTGAPLTKITISPNSTVPQITIT